MRPSAEFYGEFSGEVRFSIRLLVFEKMAEKHDRKLWSQIKAVLALRRLVSEINAKKRKNFSIFEFDPNVMRPSAEFYGEFSGEVRFSIRLLVFEKMAKNMIVSCDLKSRPFWRYDA